MIHFHKNAMAISSKLVPQKDLAELNTYKTELDAILKIDPHQKFRA